MCRGWGRTGLTPITSISRGSEGRTERSLEQAVARRGTITASLRLEGTPGGP